MSNCYTDFYNVWANLRLLPFSHPCQCFSHLFSLWELFWADELLSQCRFAYPLCAKGVEPVVFIYLLCFSTSCFENSPFISSACLLTGLFLSTGSYLGKGFVNVYSLKSVESAESVNLKWDLNRRGLQGVPAPVLQCVLTLCSMQRYSDRSGETPLYWSFKKGNVVQTYDTINIKVVYTQCRILKLLEVCKLAHLSPLLVPKYLVSSPLLFD